MFTNSLHQVCTSQYLGLCQVYTGFKPELHLHWDSGLVYTQSIFRINLQPESLLLTKTAGATLAAGDPFPPIIGALNSYLHAYHTGMYRAEALYSF